MTETDKLGREIAPEFKQGVVDEVLRGEHSIDEIAAAMSIEPSMLRRWVAPVDDDVGADEPPESDEGGEQARDDMPKKKRTRKHYTEKEQDEVIAQVAKMRADDETLTMRMACDKVGVAPSVLHRWRVMRGEANTRPTSPKKVARAIDMLKANKPLPDVATALGVNRNTIRMWAAAAGLRIPYVRMPGGNDAEPRDSQIPLALGAGTDTTTQVSRPSPPVSRPAPSAPRSRVHVAPPSYVDPPMPSSGFPPLDDFAREAMGEALEDRQTLRRFVDLLQRENEQMRRELRAIKARQG